MSPQPDQRLGAYRIVRPLDAGGMGLVFEAVHVGLNKTCALKVFETASQNRDMLRERFLREGRILARFSHPRIVKVFDLAIDETTGTPYFAMDLVRSPDGTPRTLEDVRASGRFTMAEAAVWLRDVCEALAYIHAQGVVHRDISLQNVLIGPDGHAMIADFGIARIVGDEMRELMDVTRCTIAEAEGRLRMGKLPYMAPELVRRFGERAATPASDAWALGVLFFRLLTNVWYEPNSKVIELLGDTPQTWERVIMTLCDRLPANRLPPGGMTAVPDLLKPRAAARRKRLLLALAAFAALALAALVAYFARRPGAPEPPVDLGSEILF